MTIFALSIVYNNVRPALNFTNISLADVLLGFETRGLHYFRDLPKSSFSHTNIQRYIPKDIWRSGEVTDSNKHRIKWNM